MKIRALICEDEPLARQTLRDFSAQLDWLVIIGEAADGKTAVELIDTLKPELIFLDVQMPEISGIEVLNRINSNPAVVFTTAFDNYAMSAFEHEAFDYLLKPFGRKRFQESMNRVHRRFTEKDSVVKKTNEPQKDYLTRIFVRLGNNILHLKTDDITRFEADDDYIKVFSQNRSFLIGQTLAEMEKRLDPSQFCRVHRSHLINLDFIEKAEIRDRQILLILKDKTEILASRAGSQILRTLIF